MSKDKSVKATMYQTQIDKLIAYYIKKFKMVQVMKNCVEN